MDAAALLSCPVQEDSIQDCLIQDGPIQDCLIQGSPIQGGLIQDGASGKVEGCGRGAPPNFQCCPGMVNDVGMGMMTKFLSKYLAKG